MLIHVLRSSAGKLYLDGKVAALSALDGVMHWPRSPYQPARPLIDRRCYVD